MFTFIFSDVPLVLQAIFYPVYEYRSCYSFTVTYFSCAETDVERNYLAYLKVLVVQAEENTESFKWFICFDCLFIDLVICVWMCA